MRPDYGRRPALRVAFVVFLLNWALFVPRPGLAIPGFFTSEREAGPGHLLARLTFRVLFSNSRSQEGAAIFAYGYLSRVEGVPAGVKKEDESSAAFTVVIEGRVADLGQSGSAFIVRSEGTLRVFFAPQGKRSFAQPAAFAAARKWRRITLSATFFSTQLTINCRTVASPASSPVNLSRSGARRLICNVCGAPN